MNEKINKDFNALTEDKQKIRELEEQIKKMKNCYNCANYYTKACTGCEDYCNWKLEE